MLGMGWSLGGLSAISRCPTNRAQDGDYDGVIDGVDFDSNDKFCLDGQRLVAVIGAYGASGTEYRTEIDSFSKIISHGITPNDPDWFEVQTKSGQVIEYGNTVDSRIEAQGKSEAISWAVNKISDTVGNYLTVSYFEDNTTGESYPTQIDYTGNTNEALFPYNKVVFDYGTEVRPDLIVGYVAGSKISTTRRLKNIKPYAATMVRDYQLSYEAIEPGDEIGRSRLTILKECDALGGCLPETNLHWQGPQADSLTSMDSWGTQYGYNQGWRVGTHPRMMADVNGDGLQDVGGLRAVALMFRCPRELLSPHQADG